MYNHRMSTETETPEQGKTVKTTIVLDKALVDWAKKQPGGLAVVVRLLLAQAKEGKIKVEYQMSTGN